MIRSLASRVSLNTLSPNPGSIKPNVKRLGRGPGSGKGKTCGKGEKGQLKRGSRKVRLGFEGGQTPLYLRVPKRGFTNTLKKEYREVNLHQLQTWIDSGRLDSTRKITMKHMVDSGLVSSIKDGVKLLGGGVTVFKTQIDIEVSKATKLAIEGVEARGGTITTAYYEKVGLHALISPEKWAVLPKRASPIRKRDIEYYKDPARRGYMAREEQKEIALD